MLERGLLTLVCLAPLAAFGGGYRWFTLPLLVLALLLLAVTWRGALAANRHQRVLDVALIFACACIGVQLVPFPDGLVEWLSPASRDLRRSLRLDSFMTGVWRPLSIQPEATLHALAVAVSAVVTFFAARGLFHEGGVRRWSRTLAWIGLVAALAAVAQRALSPNSIYGVWAPRDPNGQPFGPFVNRNHFAAWLLMAGFVVGGYAVAHARIHIGSGPRHLRRMLRVLSVAGTQIYVSAALVMAITIAITLSRSAMAGLVAGALSAGLLARRRLRASVTMQAALGTTAVVLGIVLAAGFVDAARVAARIDDTMRTAPDSRVVIWRDTLPLVGDFWATGVGAGAYGSAMLLYQRAGAPVHFNQAHSHYMQIAAEGGLLLVLPWLFSAVLFVRYAREAVAGDSSDVFFLRVGAACGMAAIAVQSIWETPLRMGANATLFAVLAAIVLHRRVGR